MSECSRVELSTQARSPTMKGCLLVLVASVLLLPPVDAAVSQVLANDMTNCSHSSKFVGIKIFQIWIDCFIGDQ